MLNRITPTLVESAAAIQIQCAACHVDKLHRSHRYYCSQVRHHNVVDDVHNAVGRLVRLFVLK